MITTDVHLMVRLQCSYTFTHLMRLHYMEFYILVTMHLGIILINIRLDAQYLLHIFISILYISSNLALIIRRVSCINTTCMCQSV